MIRISQLIKISILFLLSLFISNPILLSISQNQQIFQSNEKISIIEEDSILFAPMQSKITYLINKNGTVINTWSSDYLPGESVYLLDDGSIFRTVKLTLSGGGIGGGVQKITWENKLVWEYRYTTTDYCSHHDIEILPNGNILMIAWELKTKTEAIEAGRNPDKINNEILKPDHIIEVKPTGPTTGEIVWEWHIWDHLIQDFDSSKNNFGVVTDHPELIDINYGTSNINWLHTNSIDYNKELDQILISVRNFNEIWVIDHSTTTEEAAGHTGGDSGKGGDILYRWGNPAAYRAGSIEDKKFFQQHDATWIEQGYPGEGNILVFNNGVNRPGPDYSTIDEIIPPIDSNGTYQLEPGEAFGPVQPVWSYNTDFYAFYISGCQRIHNGNTIICHGPAGKFFEVNPGKEIVWDYTNPYPNFLQNTVFKLNYYTPEENQNPEKPNLDVQGYLSWNNVKTTGTVNGNFKIENTGGNISKLNWEIKEYPDWGTWTINPNSGENLTVGNGPIDVQVSVEVPNIKDTKFEGVIRVENKEDPYDFDTVFIYLKTPRNKSEESGFNLFSDLFFKNLKLLPIIKLIIRTIN